jgi:hypothetical protein
MVGKRLCWRRGESSNVPAGRPCNSGEELTPVRVVVRDGVVLTA